MLCSSLLLLAAIFVGTGASVSSWIPLRQAFHRRHARDCNPKECVEIFEPLLSRSTIINFQGIDEEHELDNTCTNIENAASCLRTNCANEPMMPIATGFLDRVHGYMCTGDMRQVLLNETACWNSILFPIGIEECDKETKKKMREDHFDDRCSLIQYYIDCASGAVRIACNENAARFLNGLLLFVAEIHECQAQSRFSRDLMGILEGFRK